MSIVSSTITRDIPLGNGLRHIVETHVSSDGQIITVRAMAPDGFDVQAQMLARVSAIEDQLAAIEFEQVTA